MLPKVRSKVSTAPSTLLAQHQMFFVSVRCNYRVDRPLARGGYGVLTRTLVGDGAAAEDVWLVLYSVLSGVAPVRGSGKTRVHATQTLAGAPTNRLMTQLLTLFQEELLTFCM
jgi:hypothetical protein